ncbi:MAG: radical SAM protein [Candidatus Omnitrophica bacterium]|nr:radical SAM protein [Candidatus Omnitrophota bacterium]
MFNTIVYSLKQNLYINLTNRCTARCVFCPRVSRPVIKEYNLRLSYEPSVEDVIGAVRNSAVYKEIVFCGFGEPTLRLYDLLEIADWLKSQGAKVRLNTNGHGNLIYRRSIVPDLIGRIDAVSVSLNAPDAATYYRIVRPDFGPQTYHAVKEFIKECRQMLPEVGVTTVGLPSLDVLQCERVAEELRTPFKVHDLWKQTESATAA